MADLGMDYDPDAVEPGRDTFDLVPVGKYPAHIVQSEVLPTKNGKGKMLKLRFDIIEGPCENRVIFEQINYQHESAQAQTIGQQQLKAICDAIGHSGPLRDTELLHNKPVLVSVGIEKDKSGQYPDKNVIKGYRSLTAAPPASKAAPQQPRSAGPAPTQQRPAAVTGAGARPWGNRAASPAT